jgi:hypothetical protein
MKRKRWDACVDTLHKPVGRKPVPIRKEHVFEHVLEEVYRCACGWVRQNVWKPTTLRPYSVIGSRQILVVEYHAPGGDVIRDVGGWGYLMDVLLPPCPIPMYSVESVKPLRVHPLVRNYGNRP